MCLLGVLAMEALHRQVLPFLLRRMKEDVLQDLPPKIIQDYYCNLSPLQVWSSACIHVLFQQCVKLIPCPTQNCSYQLGKVSLVCSDYNV